MDTALLRYTLESLNCIKDFYQTVNKYSEPYWIDELKKNSFAFKADYYLSLHSREKLSAQEEKQKNKLEKELDAYIRIPNEQPYSDDGVVLYSVLKTSELKGKGLEIDIVKGASQYRKYLKMPSLHNANTLSMIVIRFEEFIADFFHLLFNRFPEQYVDNKTIKYSEINDIGNLKAIKDYLIEKEIEMKMYENYDSWFKLFRDHGMKFDNINKEFNDLKEIMERRNIWVHNSGNVNSRYLSKIQNSQFKNHDKAEIDEKYLLMAIKTIKIIVFAIMIEAGRFLDDEEKKKYFETISDIGFELLCQEEYEVCLYIFNALKNIQQIDAVVRTVSCINYWIAKKEKSGLDSVRSEIIIFDTSVMEKRYDLAKSLLLEDYSFINAHLENLYKDRVFTAKEIKTWPIFKHYRNTKYYDEFSKKHSEDFNLESFETVKNDISCDNEDTEKPINDHIQDCENEDKV